MRNFDMKYFRYVVAAFDLFLFILLLPQGTGTLEVIAHLPSDETIMAKKWTEWKSVYQKTYTSNEEPVKFKNWLSNFRQMTRHKKRFHGKKEVYEQGVNEFFDHSPRELLGLLYPKSPFLTFWRRMKPVLLAQQRHRDVPPELNWAAVAPSSVIRGDFVNKNGWAYSAVQAVEFKFWLVVGAQTNLNVDEIVNCSDRTPKHRPLTIDAFGYMRRQGVAVQTSDRSPSPPGKVCRGDEEQEKKYIRHYYLVNPQDDQTLMVAVALMGPLSVSIKVTENFFFYQKGVFYDPACNDGRRATNHAVLLVGYGTDENGGDFWIIKNSWGPRWGQQGFARMARNAVIDCEVTSAPIYPILKIPV